MKQRIIVLRMAKPAKWERGDRSSGGPQFEASAEPGLKLEFEENPKRSLARVLASDKGVLGVAEAMPMKLIAPLKPSRTVANPHGNVAWGVKAIGADTSPFDGAGVSVAVLDTGIDADHQAFAGVDVVQRDFTGSGNSDHNGHGTHCAGTIFGRTIEGVRIGVAPGIRRALIGKVIGGPTGGGTDVLLEGMLWAYQQGAEVISMSLGIDFPGYVERLVQENGIRIAQATSMALDAYTANVRLFERLASLVLAGAAFVQASVIVAASGNESGRDQNPPFEINVAPPAAAPGILSVGALGPGESGFEVAPFSNSRVTVAAPGIDVISARAGGGKRAWSGTSMATPHVAGAAALWIQKLKNQNSLSPVTLQARLVGSASLTALSPSVDSLDVGAGLIQVPQN